MSGLTAVERLKRCTTCERMLHPDEFQVKERRNGEELRRFSSCRACRGRRVRARVVRRLPVEPLRGWVARRLELEGVWDAREMRPVPDHRAPRSIEMIARDWGTSSRRLQDILKGRTDSVTEDFADQVLTAAGVPHLLQILYDVDGSPEHLAA